MTAPSDSRHLTPLHVQQLLEAPHVENTPYVSTNPALKSSNACRSIVAQSHAVHPGMMLEHSTIARATNPFIIGLLVIGNGSLQEHVSKGIILWSCLLQRAA